MPAARTSRAPARKSRPKTGKSSMAVLEKYVLGNSRFIEIPVKDLFVDKKYQRDLNETAIKRIVANFDLNLFEPPTVNDRSEWNGYKGPRYAAIDGQHRLAAAKKIGMPTITCRLVSVHPDTEAELFVELNRQRIWLQPMAAFKAELAAGNPAAAEINNLIEARGLRVMKYSGDKGPSTIAAIVAMKKIYAASGTVGLGRTLDVVRLSWPEDDGRRFSGNILLGIHKFLIKNSKADVGKLQERLSGMTATQLLAKGSARYYAWMALGRTHEGSVDALVEEIGKAYRRTRA